MGGSGNSVVRIGSILGWAVTRLHACSFGGRGACSVGGRGARSVPGRVGLFGVGGAMGSVMASWAASANSTVVAYRLSGSLAMPVAITRSNCAGTFG
ncbi:hypothetical protein PJP10_10185 [Mycobacterium kansasii]